MAESESVFEAEGLRATLEAPFGEEARARVLHEEVSVGRAGFDDARSGLGEMNRGGVRSHAAPRH